LSIREQDRVTSWCPCSADIDEAGWEMLAAIRTTTVAARSPKSLAIRHDPFTR
jgi:hypothetical protein